MGDFPSHEDFPDAIRGGGCGGVCGKGRGLGDGDSAGGRGEFLDSLVAEKGQRDEEQGQENEGDED